MLQKKFNFDHLQPAQVTNNYFDLSHASISVETNNTNHGTELTSWNSRKTNVSPLQSIDWIAVINIVLYAILAALQTYTGVSTILFMILRC